MKLAKIDFSFVVLVTDGWGKLGLDGASWGLARLGEADRGSLILPGVSGAG